MKRIKTNRFILCVLRNAKPKLRTAILKNVHPEVIKAIAEIAYNVLQGNVSICNRVKKQLSKYKKTIRKIAVPRTKLADKRRLLINQTGGWIAPLISTILGAVLNKYI